jgi:ParB/RepB/Spo0J family partition protein
MTQKRIKLNLIDSNPFQTRVLDDSDVMPSIEKFGLLQPLIVVRPSPSSPGRYQLLFGHRRLNSLKKSGHVESLCEVRKVDDLGMIESLIAENEDRKGMSDYERGRLFKAYHEWFGVSVRDIEKIARLDDAEVARCIGIVNDEREVLGIPSVRPDAYRDAMTATKYKFAVSLQEPTKKQQALAIVTKYNLTTNETKALVKQMKENTTKPPEEVAKAIMIERERAKPDRYYSRVLAKSGETQIRCNACHADLTIVHSSAGHRLVLKGEVA